MTFWKDKTAAERKHLLSTGVGAQGVMDQQGKEFCIHWTGRRMSLHSQSLRMAHLLHRRDNSKARLIKYRCALYTNKAPNIND